MVVSDDDIAKRILIGSPLLNGGKLDLPRGNRTAGKSSGAHPSSSVRKAIHKGHKITIRTTYRIEIDGVPLTVPVIVGSDGMVSTHGLPTYAVKSAVDLVRKIIDVSALTTLPDDEIGTAEVPSKGHRKANARRS